MLPQVGVSGEMPAPRNDRIASVRTAEAILDLSEEAAWMVSSLRSSQ